MASRRNASGSGITGSRARPTHGIWRTSLDAAARNVAVDATETAWATITAHTVIIWTDFSAGRDATISILDEHRNTPAANR